MHGRGENVWTYEMAEEIEWFREGAESIEYWVSIWWTECRAGMAAVVTDAELDLAALRAHLIDRLPAYARPVFLRLRRALEGTATLQPTRHELVRQADDPAASGGGIYFNDPEGQAVVRRDPAPFCD